MTDYALKPIIAASTLVTTLSNAAAVSGDTFSDDGQQRTYLEVNNGGGGSINVTIPVKRPGPYKIPGIGAVTLADLVVAVAAGARRKIGPFLTPYIDPNTGKVTPTFNTITTVTVDAFTLPKGDA